MKSSRLGLCRKSYYEDDGYEGMVSVTPISAYKGCLFVDSARRADWFQDQGSLIVR